MLVASLAASTSRLFSRDRTRAAPPVAGPEAAEAPGVVHPAVGREQRSDEVEHDIRQRPERPAAFRPRLWLLAGLFAGVTLLTAWISEIRSGPLNLYLSVVWSLYAPLALMGIVGAIRTRRIRVARIWGELDQLVIFVIPTVARSANLPALRRVVASILRFAPEHLGNFRVDVVVDEGAEAIPAIADLYAADPHVHVVIVPDDYTTPNHTQYKARANHYALITRNQANESRPDVYVYHLDDDTGISFDTVASVASFIAEDDGTYDLAQGALAFPHELTNSTFTVLADSIRPADDFTRFQFFTGMLERPLIGLHGEHLLIRGDVEAEIGWDFGETKVEDAKFALLFCQTGRRSTFLRGFSYGASPASLGDFIKQRRRWAGGLLALAFDRSIRFRYRAVLAYAAVNWTFGPFQHLFVVLLVALALGVINTSPAAGWILIIWSMNLAYIVWQYLEGLRANLRATMDDRRYWTRALLVVPGVFVFSAVEAFAAVLGLYDLVTGKTGFEVVDKPT